MFRKLETTYKGRTIAVTNHWFKGAHVYVDGDLVAEDTRMVHMDKDVPFLTQDITTVDGVETLRLFVDANWNIKLAITVNDVLIATTHPEAVSA